MIKTTFYYKTGLTMETRQVLYPGRCDTMAADRMNRMRRRGSSNTAACCTKKKITHGPRATPGVRQ